MEFSSPHSVSKGVRVLRRKVLNVEKKLYKHGLSFYSEYPTQTVVLDDLLKYAEERLAVLRTVERINLGKSSKFSEAWRTQLEQELKKQNLNIYIKVIAGAKEPYDEDVQNARERDILSHFALRLGYSSTEENRRWFVQHETDLFRYRLIEESPTYLKQFLADENLSFQSVSEGEKTELSTELSNSSYNMTPVKVSTSEFFKVPFTEALDLIRNRRVFLKKGFAYVPFEEFGSIIGSFFRAQISQAMVITARGRSVLEPDQRLHRLLADFEKRSPGQESVSFVADGNIKITYQMLDGLSKQSYPLCMRNLHDSLRTAHHLKHGGRMQYGLFLKGIGVSLEDSVKFWREEFSKTMDVDKFEKNYAYNIRHNYGKEGNKVNYTPYGCSKIINGSVGPGDHHGCPFKHFDAKELKNRLQVYKAPAAVIDEILQLVAGKHYQIACQRYFEASHGVELQGGIHHPNQYFLESQKILNGDAKPGKERVKVETIRDVSYSQDVIKPSQASVGLELSQLTDGVDFDDDFGADTSAMDDSTISN